MSPKDPSESPQPTPSEPEDLQRIFDQTFPKQTDPRSLMPGWYRAPRGRPQSRKIVIGAEVEIARRGDGTRALAALGAANLSSAHPRMGDQIPLREVCLPELEVLRAGGVRLSALSVPINALAPSAGQSEATLFELIAYFAGWDRPDRPLLVVPCGAAPDASSNPVYSPRDRGEVQRTLARWLRAADRAAVEMAAEPRRGEVIGNAAAAEHFIEAHGGKRAGLALSPQGLLDAPADPAPALLKLLLRLAPWSRLLYVEDGAAWVGANASGIDSSMLARALRAPGLPPRLTLRGVAAEQWAAARAEVHEGFSSLGLELNE